MLGEKHFSKRTPKSNINKSFKAMGKSMQQLAVCFTNNSSLSKSHNLVVDENNKTQLIQLLQNCSWKCKNLYWKIEARKPPDWHGNVYRRNPLEIGNVSLSIINKSHSRFPLKYIIINTVFRTIRVCWYTFSLHLSLILLTLWRKNTYNGVHTM